MTKEAEKIYRIDYYSRREGKYKRKYVEAVDTESALRKARLADVLAWDVPPYTACSEDQVMILLDAKTVEVIVKLNQYLKLIGGCDAPDATIPIESVGKHVWINCEGTGYDVYIGYLGTTEEILEKTRKALTIVPVKL